MRLAKDRLDIGLSTFDAAMIDFMADEVGLGPPEELPVGRGLVQHRFDVDGSVIKVNLSERSGGVEGIGGYSEVLIADEAAVRPTPLTGPDGVRVALVPTGHLDVTQLGVRVAVPDLKCAQQYFGHTLGWPVDGPMVHLGATVLLLDESKDAPRSVEPGIGGWSYLTVQIHDCDLETAQAVARGARLTRPPTTLGDVARFSMVADDWGNVLELSQRASLTGPLPPN